MPLGDAVPGLEVCDYGDADLVAIGLAAPSVPGLLVYVSCWKERPCHVFYTIEVDEVGVDEAENMSLAGFISAAAQRVPWVPLGSKERRKGAKRPLFTTA